MYIYDEDNKWKGKIMVDEYQPVKALFAFHKLL